MSQLEPTFNLWTEPWITLERADGALEDVGIEQALLESHRFRAIYDPSPLVVVGIHRLLTAILQDALDPQRPGDLAGLWREERFSEETIREFGARYADRFDLFSEATPFLQSADLPRTPPRGADLKPVMYLMPDFPTGSGVTHYRHGSAADGVFCAVCAARGLVTIPPFATSGGAGIKPSINGVPPIYVVPGGETLFASLAASLVLPPYQPKAASSAEDAAWWRREPVVPHKAVVHEVGYVHSLTFPARRVRLHPTAAAGPCARCGRQDAWSVQTMVFQMGESRPGDAPFWFDPFAAYRMREGKEPVPVRPLEGRVLWREFAALFLPSDEKEHQTIPPTVIYQLANEPVRTDQFACPVRCVGLRTDMKAKVFEWVDAGFDVPLELARGADAADLVRDGIDYAVDCAGIIAKVFRQTFGGEGNTERYAALRQRMEADYWAALAGPFRQFVLDVAREDTRAAAERAWVAGVARQAYQSFETHSKMTSSDAATLAERVQGCKRCRILLGSRRKEQLPNEPTND